MNSRWKVQVLHTKSQTTPKHCKMYCFHPHFFLLSFGTLTDSIPQIPNIHFSCPPLLDLCVFTAGCALHASVYQGTSGTRTTRKEKEQRIEQNIKLLQSSRKRMMGELKERSELVALKHSVLDSERRVLLFSKASMMVFNQFFSGP